MITKRWMFDPNSGGVKIPPTVQADVEKRIHAVAEKEFMVNSQVSQNRLS